MAEETRSFEAEVSKLLHIVATSLYSEKQIFLRELISNASDACDRLRYAAIAEPELIRDDPTLRITLSCDKRAKTLSIADNGVGMDRDELIGNLGTIARSGTSDFVEQLAGEAGKDGAKDGAKDGGKNVSLIGKFGVGFYSAFIVADEVTVTSRKAGQDQAWRWRSSGGGEFSIGEAERAGRGTTVTLHLKKGETEFLEAARLGHVVKTYSDHIALPIVLEGEGAGDGDTLNTASALWTRPRKDITAEQYKEFYHHVGHAFDDPWLTVHTHVEGKIEYTLLLFVPTLRPPDLFDPTRQPQVKLYAKRVFITDDCADLVPSNLRFLRGIVASEDLQLNLSREILQDNPLVRTIRKALTKRVLGALKKKADKEPEAFAAFWTNFGAVVKEGIYDDATQRDELLALARFHSTQSGAELTTLDQVVDRMKEGQQAIYYITGDELAPARKSPQLEGFAARGLEVLLLTDPIDEFWVAAVGSYRDKPFRSVTRGGADLGDMAAPAEAGGEAAAPDNQIGTLIALVKLSLGERVKDVRPSQRLTDSAVCLVADESDLDIHLERLLKQHRHIDQASARILEINPRHRLIKTLAKAAGKEGAADRLADAAELLLEQALILEGEPLPDPSAFARRLADVMAHALDVDTAAA